MSRHNAPPKPKPVWPGWRGLPEVARRRVAAYRVKPRECLWDAPSSTFQFFVFGPLISFAFTVGLLVHGTWWQRLLALPAAACGAAWTQWTVWYVQRPALPREPGLIQSFQEWRRSRGT